MTPHFPTATSTVQRFAADLAARHGIVYEPTALDRFAHCATGLSDDPVVRDPTRDTLLALRRANVIDAEMHAHLLLTHLRECRAARTAP
jgi:hypothetical protein